MKGTTSLWLVMGFAGFLCPVKADWPAVFSSAQDVIQVSDGFTPPEEDVVVTLAFAPETGTSLMLVENTGPGFIDGEFPNLPQGELISTEYGGRVYSFVADYFGGTGNDLVLRWAPTRVIGWGSNDDGQIDSGGPGAIPTPVQLVESALTTGRQMRRLSIGSKHSVQLAADGSAAALGAASGSTAILGGGEIGPAIFPVPVMVNEELIDVAIGGAHCVALGRGGEVFCWGSNLNGALGVPGMVQSSVPVPPSESGALAGRSLVAVAAGGRHTLVLCSDGSLAAWGYNSRGILGVSESSRLVESPALVDMSGVLAGKSVVRIAAGGFHNLVLCSDGTLFSWGENREGQLGDGSTTRRAAPVAVDLAGALAGKTVKDIACGNIHSLALCSDGTVAAWGANGSGQLGPGSSGSHSLPVLLDASGVLAGKTVVGISAGSVHSVLLCSDGTVVATGSNSNGQLGTGSIDPPASLPVVSQASTPPGGGRVVAVHSGEGANLAIVAIEQGAPVVESVVPSSVTSSSVLLQGMVNPLSNPATASFDFGDDESYGTSYSAVPNSVEGVVFHPVGSLVTGLQPETSYRYRVGASNAIGSSVGEEIVFTTLASAGDAHLASLSTDVGELSPSFVPGGTRYEVVVPSSAEFIVPTASTSAAGATVTIDGQEAVSGAPGPARALRFGSNLIEIRVTAPDELTVMNYELTVIREIPDSIAWELDDLTSIPVSADGFEAAGRSIYPSLGFAPPVGADLVLVENRSRHPIQGVLNNLTQGEPVSLDFGGESFAFVVDYHGGDGNDLILRWAFNRVVAWGYNENGRLGDGSRVNRPRPVVPGAPGAFAGLTALGGSGFCGRFSDGSLREWGRRAVGLIWEPAEPHLHLNTSGALDGSEVWKVSVAHNFAVLSTDGRVFMRGWNQYGQIGIGSYGSGSDLDVPEFVEVDRSGLLAGREVVATAISRRHSYVLCSDGRILSWGRNIEGQLGNELSDGGSLWEAYALPSLVSDGGALAGKEVVEIDAGMLSGYALCSDGSVAAWGGNSVGQLGNGTAVDSATPTAVDSTGVLSGRQVIDIAAGSFHCLALCADGTLAAWGLNLEGELGDGSTVESRIPVAVEQTGAMAGRTVNKIAASGARSYALCDDGSLFAWGSNAFGGLGVGSFTSSAVPLEVSTDHLGSGARFVEIIPVRGDATSSSDSKLQSVAIAAFPAPTQPLELWKEQQVGDAFASDLGDSDNDGYPLLVEYALGLNPNHRDTGGVGGISTYPEGERLSMSFVRDESRTDVSILIEASDTLSDPWETVGISVAGGEFSGDGVFRDESIGNGLRAVEVRDVLSPGHDAPRRFIRARVTR